MLKFVTRLVLLSATEDVKEGELNVQSINTASGTRRVSLFVTAIIVYALILVISVLIAVIVVISNLGTDDMKNSINNMNNLLDSLEKLTIEDVRQVATMALQEAKKDNTIDTDEEYYNYVIEYMKNLGIKVSDYDITVTKSGVTVSEKKEDDVTDNNNDNGENAEPKPDNDTNNSTDVPNNNNNQENTQGTSKPQEKPEQENKEDNTPVTKPTIPPEDTENSGNSNENNTNNDTLYTEIQNRLTSVEKALDKAEMDEDPNIEEYQYMFDDMEYIKTNITSLNDVQKQSVKIRLESILKRVDKIVENNNNSIIESATVTVLTDSWGNLTDMLSIKYAELKVEANIGPDAPGVIDTKEAAKAYEEVIAKNGFGNVTLIENKPVECVRIKGNYIAKFTITLKADGVYTLSELKIDVNN